MRDQESVPLGVGRTSSPTPVLAVSCKNQWNKLSGTWKERRDEGARKERRANANRLSQSPSSVSAALLGLSGLANDNSNGVAWDASALLSVAISPKVATAEASQRGEKRRRQVIEAQKPFNDDALREAVSPFRFLSSAHALAEPPLTLLGWAYRVRGHATERKDALDRTAIVACASRPKRPR